jgi:hypothetical protein
MFRLVLRSHLPLFSRPSVVSGRWYSQPIEFKIDTKGLSSPRPHEVENEQFSSEIFSDAAWEDWSKGKKEGGNLQHYLRGIISISGPMTVANYMKECLTHPSFGYYMKSKSHPSQPNDNNNSQPNTHTQLNDNTHQSNNTQHTSSIQQTPTTTTSDVTTSPNTTTTSDVFGVRGDFITSPEISQMFGETIGLLCIQNWLQLGKPSVYHLIEVTMCYVVCCIHFFLTAHETDMTQQKITHKS